MTEGLLIVSALWLVMTALGWFADTFMDME